jgi:hypothetical protein
MLSSSLRRGIITEEREAKEANVDFYRCPFCTCCFLSIQDLERHMAAFGNIKEQHEEACRRTHGRAEYGSAE